MKNMHCIVFSHDYKVTRQVTYHVKEYTCRYCKKQLTTAGNGNLIELTPKFREINDVLERIYQKRKIKALNLKNEVNKTNSNNILVFNH